MQAILSSKKGLEQISDSGEIEKLIDAIIADSPSQLADYKGGNQNLFGWFVGQAMKRSGGKANPKEVNRILREKL